MSDRTGTRNGCAVVYIVYSKYSTIQYNTIQYNTVQYSTVQYPYDKIGTQRIAKATTPHDSTLSSRTLARILPHGPYLP